MMLFVFFFCVERSPKIHCIIKKKSIHWTKAHQRRENSFFSINRLEYWLKKKLVSQAVKYFFWFWKVIVGHMDKIDWKKLKDNFFLSFDMFSKDFVLARLSKQNTWKISRKNLYKWILFGWICVIRCNRHNTLLVF